MGERAPLDGWSWFYMAAGTGFGFVAVWSAWFYGGAYVIPFFFGCWGFWMLAVYHHAQTVRRAGDAAGERKGSGQMNELTAKQLFDFVANGGSIQKCRHCLKEVAIRGREMPTHCPKCGIGDQWWWLEWKP